MLISKIPFLSILELNFLGSLYDSKRALITGELDKMVHICQSYYLEKDMRSMASCAVLPHSIPQELTIDLRYR